MQTVSPRLRLVTKSWIKLDRPSIKKFICPALHGSRV
jgi:hypothetical protein